MSLAARVHGAAHLTGLFRLRSGALSHEYFDKYRLESDPVLLGEIAERMVALLPPDADALAGLELGGVPLATAMSRASGLPARFVRRRAKEYGTRQLAEGGEIDGLQLVIVEDVVSTGGAIVESCRELRALGARVTVALACIDRGGGAEALGAAGLELRALFGMDELRAAGAGRSRTTAGDG